MSPRHYKSSDKINQDSEIYLEDIKQHIFESPDPSKSFDSKPSS